VFMNRTLTYPPGVRTAAFCLTLEWSGSPTGKIEDIDLRPDFLSALQLGRRGKMPSYRPRVNRRQRLRAAAARERCRRCPDPPPPRSCDSASPGRAGRVSRTSPSRDLAEPARDCVW